MGTIKTAISIDEKVYNEVENMAEQLHISRSQFFSQAAQYMIERRENLELLQKINSAYDSVNKSGREKKQRKQEKKYTLRRMSERWK